jgi:probable phosphoglycerate mutase
VELILVRHALPERREVAEGPADPELSPAGHAQAELMANYLRTEHIDAIYTSPMRRAFETAAPLGRAFGIDPAVEPDVAEYDQHASEYVPVEELKATGDPRWTEIEQGLDVEHEEFGHFTRRVLSALERIVERHAGQQVVVVCHGGVINVYLGHVLGVDFSPPGFIYPNYTSLHRFAASRSGVRSVVTVNETAHLRHSGLPMGLFQRGDVPARTEAGS